MLFSLHRRREVSVPVQEASDGAPAVGVGDRWRLAVHPYRALAAARELRA
jgi:hypothetical protein